MEDFTWYNENVITQPFQWFSTEFYTEDILRCKANNYDD